MLQRQSDRVQAFLLRTSILDQLSGALCDAVLREPAGSAQATLEELERANLFIVPLDDERRWYRYHHLFADLLRQRLQQSGGDAPVRWRNYTVAPASGTRSMDWKLRPFIMPRLPMTSNARSA